MFFNVLKSSFHNVSYCLIKSCQGLLFLRLQKCNVFIVPNSTGTHQIRGPQPNNQVTWKPLVVCIVTTLTNPQIRLSNDLVRVRRVVLRRCGQRRCISQSYSRTFQFGFSWFCRWRYVSPSVHLFEVFGCLILNERGSSSAKALSRIPHTGRC